MYVLCWFIWCMYQVFSVRFGSGHRSFPLFSIATCASCIHSVNGIHLVWHFNKRGGGLVIRIVVSNLIQSTVFSREHLWMRWRWVDRVISFGWHFVAPTNFMCWLPPVHVHTNDVRYALHRTDTRNYFITLSVDQSWLSYGDFSPFSKRYHRHNAHCFFRS